jgi:hypothetical protein
MAVAFADAPFSGSLTQVDFSSMEAQVLAAITSNVMSTKPTAMNFEISSSSVPRAGSR